MKELLEWMEYIEDKRQQRKVRPQQILYTIFKAIGTPFRTGAVR